MSVASSTTKAQSEIVENSDELTPINHKETPRCEIHPGKEAESICDQCGRRICGIDMTKSGTIEICQKCFLDDAQDEEFGNKLVWPLFVVPIAIVITVFVGLQLGNAF